VGHDETRAEGIVIRRSAIIGLLLMSSSAVALAQSPYVPPQRDFSAVFPSSPSVAADSAATPNGPGFRSYLAEEGHRAYLITIDEYPLSIPVPAPSQTTYALLLKAHAKEASLRLDQTHETKLAGRAALEGSFRGEDGRLEVRRVLMVDRRIFQVSFTNAGGTADADKAQSFLDSFRLKGR
jgi:hypothetical protein